MKKVILFVQFIFMMFYLSYGYAQTSGNTASESIDYFDLIKHTSADEDNSSGVLTFRYPDVSFSVFSKKNTVGESVQYVSLTKDKKTLELELNNLFDLTDIEHPPLYFKHKNTHILIHQEFDYYFIGFYVFILDEKGRFYQLGGFNFTPLDVEEPTYEKIKFDVLKRGDVLSILPNKDFDVIYKLKP